MRSSFSGLYTGYTGLAAQQKALNITGHNVANANTEGYTRQEAIMKALPALKTLNGYVGTGVEVTEIRRVRDQFLDMQMRTEQKALGEWEVKSDILNKLEVIFNEPSETGLRSVIDQFWEAWQTLYKNPENIAARTTVAQRSATLVNTYNHLDAQFFDLQTDINKSVAVKVNEINSYAQQIANLNDQIIKGEVGGRKANDLRDGRDLLLEQLSRIVDIDIVEDSLGSVLVTIGGKFLVSRNTICEMKFTDNFDDPTEAKIEWYDSLGGVLQGSVSIKGGALKGYLDMRDVVLPEYERDMSLLAKTIAEEVNALHRTGYGLVDTDLGRDFFTKLQDGDDFSLKNIEVNPLLMGDPNYIAAADKLVLLDPDDPTSGVVYQGDGANALAIAQLKNKLTMSGKKVTFADFYRSKIGGLGIKGQEASFMVDNRSLLVEQLINRRDSVSGVSLDEEMTNMIKFQHAYSASARVINVMDEMLETIVHRLGMVGR